MHSAVRRNYAFSDNNEVILWIHQVKKQFVLQVLVYYCWIFVVFNVSLPDFFGAQVRRTITDKFFVKSVQMIRAF